MERSTNELVNNLNINTTFTQQDTNSITDQSLIINEHQSQFLISPLADNPTNKITPILDNMTSNNKFLLDSIDTKSIFLNEMLSNHTDKLQKDIIFNTCIKNNTDRTLIVTDIESYSQRNIDSLLSNNTLLKEIETFIKGISDIILKDCNVMMKEVVENTENVTTVVSNSVTNLLEDKNEVIINLLTVKTDYIIKNSEQTSKVLDTHINDMISLNSNLLFGTIEKTSDMCTDLKSGLDNVSLNTKSLNDQVEGNLLNFKSLLQLEFNNLNELFKLKFNNLRNLIYPNNIQSEKEIYLQKMDQIYRKFTNINDKLISIDVKQNTVNQSVISWLQNIDNRLKIINDKLISIDVKQNTVNQSVISWSQNNSSDNPESIINNQDVVNDNPESIINNQDVVNVNYGFIINNLESRQNNIGIVFDIFSTFYN